MITARILAAPSRFFRIQSIAYCVI
jgi:hypothetical protein